MKRAVWWVGAVAILWMSGCRVSSVDASEGPSPKPAEGTEESRPASTGSAGQAAPEPSNDFAALLPKAESFVPQDSAVIALIDLKLVVERLKAGFLGPLIRGAIDDKLQGELSKLFQERLGFDPLAARVAIVFAAVEGNYGGVLIGGDFKITAGKETEKDEIEGVPAIRIPSPRILVIPVKGFGIALIESRSQARKYVLGVLKAKPDQVKPGSLPELMKLAVSNPNAWLSVAVAIQGTKLERKWEEPAPILRPDRAVLHLTPSVAIADVYGSPDCLDSIVKALQELRTKAREAVGKARKELELYPVIGAAGILVADHMLESTFDAIMPKRQEGFLHFEISADAAGVSSVGGILAAIAVPAFIKYQRKAMTTEAIDYLDKIYKGAADYYVTPRVKEDSFEKLPCQFPESQPVTPSAGTCCKALGGPDQDGDNRCDALGGPESGPPPKGKKGRSEPPANPWDTPTWSALRFEITQPHYFVYEFTSNGKTGVDAEFVATAYGDLDCDGVRSTFQRFGKADPRCSDFGECCVASRAALFVNNETE